MNARMLRISDIRRGRVICTIVRDMLLTQRDTYETENRPLSYALIWIGDDIMAILSIITFAFVVFVYVKAPSIIKKSDKKVQNTALCYAAMVSWLIIGVICLIKVPNQTLGYILSHVVIWLMGASVLFIAKRNET